MKSKALEVYAWKVFWIWIVLLGVAGVFFVLIGIVEEQTLYMRLVPILGGVGILVLISTMTKLTLKARRIRVRDLATTDGHD